MIIEQMGYALRCDFPECNVDTMALGDYAFWADLSTAEDEWRDHEGIVTDDGRTFCYEHVVWAEDEDGDEVRAPMEPTLANLVLLANRRVLRKIEWAEQEALRRLDRRCGEMSYWIDVRADSHIQYVPF